MYFFYSVCNCFTGSCPHGEQATQMFGADTAGARLSHTCSPAHAPAPVHHGLPYPLCVLRQ